MIRKIYSIFLVVLIVAIAALNFYAYKFHWYFFFWWFDIVMHTLGGVWVSGTVLWIWYFRNADGEKKELHLPFVFLFALASVYIVGVGWELFEFSLDKFITFKIHDMVNTGSDLFFDGVGSIFAVLIFWVVYNGIKKKEKR
jgi:hypothetical protein